MIDYDCDGGHKFTGPGFRKWTCWVDGDVRREERKEKGPLERAGERLTDAMWSATAVMGAVASQAVTAAFTPGVTGS